MTIKRIWQFSQNHLNLLSTCPRKFQYTYLENFTSPCLPQRQSRLNLGNRFHYLMQQRELGLRIDRILEADQPLKKLFHALNEVAPNIVNPQPNTWREAEHRRTFLKGNFLLTGIYDLLILSETEAKIIDWKTYAQPGDQESLVWNWQTRLYLYLLAETSDYSPEQIKFIYWFIEASKKPTSVAISYDEEQHKKAEEDLRQIFQNITAYWEEFQERDQSFPQVEESKGYCVNCPFVLPCGRNLQNKERFLSEVTEVKLE